MSENKNKIVLVTGASSGIGAATARAFCEAGWTTYASARRVESLENLRQLGCHVLPLDVTDEASMLAAVRAIETQHGAVGVLINNAGYCQMGPLEELPLRAMRAQFETNVFGLLRMTQLVLPAMRERRRGRIINVSSMGGEVTFMGMGAYHASKYAVESLTDALRAEVAPWGVQVVAIQPGGVRSGFGHTVNQLFDHGEPDSLYAPFRRGMEHGIKAMDAPDAKGLLSPEAVARVIVRAATAKRPQTRYKIGIVAKFAARLRCRMPDRWWDAATARLFPAV